MRTRLTLKPGQRGTKALLEEYGERLVCVRYRYDEQRRRRIKTAEIVVEEVEWGPASAVATVHDEPPVSATAEADGPPRRSQVALLNVDRFEVDLQRSIRAAGGGWNSERRRWVLPVDRALELGLRDRIVSTE